MKVAIENSALFSPDMSANKNALEKVTFFAFIIPGRGDL